MSSPFNKENETTVISQTMHDSRSSSPVRPLKSQRSLNSLNTSMTSPNRKLDPSPTRRRKDTSPVANGTSTAFTNLQIDYNKLERKYTDLLLQKNQISSEHAQLESDLITKESAIKEKTERISNYEAYIRKIQDDYSKNKELLTKEIHFYKELIDELQLKVRKLTDEVDVLKKNAPHHSPDTSRDNHDLQDIVDISEKFNRLLKDFKVLQSNFELERNSKLVLIDQIEYLTKELSSHNSMKSSPQNPGDILEGVDDSNTSADSVIHNITNTIHTMNALTDEDNDDSNETDLNDSNVLSNLAEDLQIKHSSPIRNQLQYVPDGSLEISNGFQFPPPEPTKLTYESKLQPQFPPSPDPESKYKKRQSLPAKIKASPQFDNEEFVLSPLKLAGNTSQYFDSEVARSSPPQSSIIDRYSYTKPTHSRYNSHDILPIKVEFESPDSSIRSTSVPEKDHQRKKFEIINETPELPGRGSSKSAVRNSAFFALNGYDSEPFVPTGNSAASNRNSIATATSSKRSSMILENPTQDMTKQEIMKLKFELQSLKLHNEKLLSYIGFELQKQKNNIKKLSNKQSARALEALNSVNKKYEYSDAKLIESSKDMLINKKRVLRSVSINPILSKNYGNTSSKVTTNSLGILGGKGILPFINAKLETLAHGEDFIDLAEKGADEDDDYGFLKHSDKFSKRIFSNGLQAYLNCEELDETDVVDESFESDNERNVKKYKSQSFLVSKVLFSSDEEDDEDEDDEAQVTAEDIGDVSRRDSWDSDGANISSDEEMGMLTQIKYLILGSSAIQSKKPKKRKEQQQLVDDGLKLKFLTITLGIMIIGLKLSHQNNNH